MNPFSQILNFAVYIATQVLLVRNLVLFDRGFCFIYIGFLLLIPFEISTTVLMLIGFGTGLIVDIFYDTLGMHTAACVLLMFLRQSWINLLTPRGGYENVYYPSLKMMGVEWFATYALPLIFVHHLLLFYLEAAGFEFFFFTLTKVLASVAFTFLTILIVQFLFYPAPKKP
ncbi:Rod shape-determining protein MreD [Xanthovirga aplysinae]|uniref:Rod shape-determining protein MreD n=1 Tax=Xanthovirga aplysinae TaxID=2529853 RepID=UPI0012BD56C6|nr:Rod shape-determining protein MreD [Xanthovirga aplysinae]MTI33625.1 Rod shape-determining protein MreD [Xanthovirga aplysinae]